jgi:predicted nuclease with TOPRIM domain
MKTLKENVAKLQTANLDLRMDVNQDRAEAQNSLDTQISRVEDNLDKQELRNRSNIEDVRGVINTFELRFESTIKAFEERMDSKMYKLDTKLDDLEEALDKKIQRAIDNPLAGN